MGVGGQCHAPAALPQGKTRYPLYRRLGTLTKVREDKGAYDGADFCWKWMDKLN